MRTAAGRRNTESGRTSDKAPAPANTARDLPAQVRPALVITDEYLAGSTTGSDLLRVLRRKYGRNVGRALVITGLPGDVTVLSTDVVIEKPFDLRKLVEVVRSILGEPPKAREAH